MNKQALIDKAVEHLEGKWCGTESQDYLLYRPEAQGAFYHPFYVTYDDSMLGRHHGMTRREFNQRARELGWINGYKYGVEYETNGKKPDLPDDLYVEYKNKHGIWHKLGPDRVDTWVWHDGAKAFRMVDERYKPVEVVTEIQEKQQNVTVLSEDNQKSENVSSWFDYDKQQAIALPPVGVECEYNE